MIEVFVLLIAATTLAFLYEYSSTQKLVASISFSRRKKIILGSNFFFVILVVVMSGFAGLRTTMNDTATYLISFNTKVSTSLSAIFEISTLIGANPLFSVYRILIKSLVSQSAHVFIYISSAIVVTSMLLFMKKYAVKFHYTMYFFITFTVYAFTMAAMKQTIATAIAIWAIPCFLENKYIKSILIILIAMLVHPYVFLYFSIFIFSKNLWDKKTGLLIVSTILLGTVYVYVMPLILPVLAAMGDSYELDYFTGDGVNLFRLLFYCIVPVLSFINRKSLRECDDKFFNLSINLSIVSTCFMILASFGGANMFGRMANYFDLFHCFSIPIILLHGKRLRRFNSLIMLILILIFAVFYYTYYSKYLFLGSSFYKHISFLELLRSW